MVITYASVKLNLAVTSISLFLSVNIFAMFELSWNG
jgi:hypothetical protein